MIYVNEMELFDLGPLCGIVGQLMPETEKRLTDALERVGCLCLLFCYRGKDDDRLVRFLRAYARGNPAVRLVFVNNEQETLSVPLLAQKTIDNIYSWVDMVLRSTWPLEDLPVCVAVHSDTTICLADEEDESIFAKIRALQCGKVHKLR